MSYFPYSYMCVIYICVYTNIRVYTHMCIYIQIYVYTHICVYIYMYIYIYTNMCIHIRMYIYIYVQLYLSLYICIYIYTYIHIYRYIYIYIYACPPTPARPSPAQRATHPRRRNGSSRPRDGDGAPACPPRWALAGTCLGGHGPTARLGVAVGGRA